MEASSSPSSSTPSISKSTDIIADLVAKPFGLRSVEECNWIVLQELPKPMISMPLSEKIAEKVKNDLDLSYCYEKYDWLCGSVRRKAVFCWPCLLMSKKRKAFSLGISELSSFRANSSRHPKSKEHKNCNLQLIMAKNKVLNKIKSTKVEEESLRKAYNEEVSKNLEIMKALIDMVFLTLNDYQDRTLKFESIIKLFNLIWESKPELKNHWLNQSYFSTDQSFLNILLECMKEELIIFMEKEINNCNFYACYCDDLSSITGTNHCSLSIRLVDQNGIVNEYFLGFFELGHTRNPDDMFALIFNNLRLYDVKEKLVAYTCDGTCVISGRQIEFQNIMAKMIPGALFSSCFSRPLLSVIKQSCSKILKLNEFFSHFEGIMEFLAKLRPYNIPNLEEIVQNNFELPDIEYLDLVTCKNMTFMIVQQERLLLLFNEILESTNYNSEIITKAMFYKEKLSELDFIFYLNVFKDIFSSITVLEISLRKCFENRNFVQNGVQAVSRCLVTLNNWKNDAFFLAHIAALQPKNKTLVLDLNLVNSYKARYHQILENVIRQLGERFLTFEKFEFMQLSHTNITFNDMKVIMGLAKSVTSNYDVLNTSEVVNEMECLLDPKRRVFEEDNLQDLVKRMVYNNTNDILPSVYRMYTLLLTLPLSDEDEEFSCYRRIRKYLRNSSPVENLFSPFALLFIEQNTLKRLKAKDTFYDDIIKRFCTTTAGFNISVPLVLK